MSGRQARVPPRWFVRLAWYVHRAIYRVTFGRVGLWRAKPDLDGFAALRSSETAVVILEPRPSAE